MAQNEDDDVLLRDISSPYLLWCLSAVFLLVPIFGLANSSHVPAQGLIAVLAPLLASAWLGYLALAGEHDDYADTLREGAATRTPEQNARLSGLGKQTEEAFDALLQGSPAHIRALYDAVRTAIDAEASRT